MDLTHNMFSISTCISEPRSDQVPSFSYCEDMSCTVDNLSHTLKAPAKKAYQQTMRESFRKNLHNFKTY